MSNSYEPMDCSPPSSSVCGIFTLEWDAISFFSRASLSFFYSCLLPLLSLPNDYRHKIDCLLEMGNGQREKYVDKSVKASKYYYVHM